MTESNKMMFAVFVIVFMFMMRGGNIPLNMLLLAVIAFYIMNKKDEPATAIRPKTTTTPPPTPVAALDQQPPTSGGAADPVPVRLDPPPTPPAATLTAHLLADRADTATFNAKIAQCNINDTLAAKPAIEGVDLISAGATVGSPVGTGDSEFKCEQFDRITDSRNNAKWAVWVDGDKFYLIEKSQEMNLN